MVAIASHLWFVQPVVGSYISIGVGYCFIQQQGQCEKPHQLGKAISSHTFFFIRYSQGIGWHSFKIIMRENLSVVYETPQAEVINLELEQAVLQGSEKDDPDITIPGMGWDD